LSNGWWDQHVVPRLIGCCCRQPPIMAQRAQVVPQADGDVLELGAGGGANFALYDKRRLRSLSGIDPSLPLLDRARKDAAALGLDIDLREGVAESLPFDAHKFDTVLCTFTLCSVQNPAAALAEVSRVLRPDGRLLFLEHGAAPDPRAQVWQNRIEPIWKHIAGGCHLTRPVTDAITAAGFSTGPKNGKYMPKTPHFLGWVEWGEARCA
jgi:ubiquinone/menaquinone biosynthesis C-methylase UbiE